MRAVLALVLLSALPPVANAQGGRENTEAIAFLRRMNELVFGEQRIGTAASLGAHPCCGLRQELALREIEL